MSTAKSKLFAASLIGALAWPLASQAATYGNGSKSASFDVTMKIVADCTIAATGMDFGQNQGVLSSALTATSNINVTCSNTTPYNVGLNAGTGAGSSGNTRYMSGTGANTGSVQFNLFQSPGASPWGNTQGTDTLSGVGTGALQTLTVYGQVPAQQTPAPDSYKSTVTAIVYF